ncbi:hypothetical protein T10_4363 [Trichinella papuae]|uniref:Uncharacterized protein n=1 Tax=Trichinella papuae TaxID=268474 RepID=A0A0V1MTP0_9BILA|nr:hypothetical protein T10_4363 [Trichinella papuae]
MDGKKLLIPLRYIVECIIHATGSPGCQQSNVRTRRKLYVSIHSATINCLPQTSLSQINQEFPDHDVVQEVWGSTLPEFWTFGSRLLENRELAGCRRLIGGGRGFFIVYGEDSSGADLPSRFQRDLCNRSRPLLLNPSTLHRHSLLYPIPK